MGAMHVSRWHNGMKVGIETVDEDHRTLFAILGELDSALDAGTTPEWTELIDILDRLGAYARNHFQREEEIQREVGYEGLEENQRQHAELTRTLDAFATRLKTDPSADIHLASEAMRSFLTVWVTEHVLKVDHKMRGRILPWSG